MGRWTGIKKSGRIGIQDIKNIIANGWGRIG